MVQNAKRRIFVSPVGVESESSVMILVTVLGLKFVSLSWGNGPIAVTIRREPGKCE